MTIRDLLLEIKTTLKGVETKLDCHLDAYRLHCQQMEQRVDKLEEETRENTSFRNKIIGVLIILNISIPVAVIAVEKWLG